MQSPWKVQTFKVWSCEADTTPMLGSRARPLQEQQDEMTHFLISEGQDELYDQWRQAVLQSTLCLVTEALPDSVSVP